MDLTSQNIVKFHFNSTEAPLKFEIITQNIFSVWVFFMFLANYFFPARFINPMYLLIFISICFYAFVLALLLANKIKLALLVAAVGVFSKLIPIYLLYVRRPPQAAANLYVSASIFLLYLIFLDIQNTNVYETYKKVIIAANENPDKIATIAMGILP
jgi:hypothetical protein